MRLERCTRRPPRALHERRGSRGVILLGLAGLLAVGMTGLRATPPSAASAAASAASAASATSQVSGGSQAPSVLASTPSEAPAGVVSNKAAAPVSAQGQAQGQGPGRGQGIPATAGAAPEAAGTAAVEQLVRMLSAARVIEPAAVAAAGTSTGPQPGPMASAGTAAAASPSPRPPTAQAAGQALAPRAAPVQAAPVQESTQRSDAAGRGEGAQGARVAAAAAPATSDSADPASSRKSAEAWEEYHCAGKRSLQVRYQLGASGAVARLRVDAQTLALAYDDRSTPEFVVYAGQGYWWQPELRDRGSGAAPVRLTAGPEAPARPGGSAAGLYRGRPPFGDVPLPKAADAVRSDCHPR